MLVVHPGVELYGSDRMVYESVIGLVEAGESVEVIVPAAGPLTTHLDGIGVRWRAMAMPVLRKAALSPRGFGRLVVTALRSTPPTLRLLLRQRPRIVYVSTQTIPSWILAARVTGARTVCHVHEAERHPRTVVEAGLFGPLLAAHDLIANSEYSASVLRAAMPRLTERTRVIANGVAGPPAVTAPREALTGGPRVLYLGRLSPRKGPDVALRAVRKPREHGVPVRLDLLGDAFAGYEWFAERLRTDAADLIASGAVRFCGFRNSIWETIAQADIVIVPSTLPEPFGNTAVEARLAARPVIASDIGGLPEAVAGSESSRLVPPDDPEALAAALADVIDTWPAARAAAIADAPTARESFDPRRYRRGVAEATLGQERPARAQTDQPAPRPLRVMQSFSEPRATTNPYIVQLAASLSADPDIEHLPFSWRSALTRRLDVVHLHWPEVRLEGTGARRLIKHGLYAMALARWTIGRVTIVRTVHNLDLPDVPPASRLLLRLTERSTHRRILINSTTEVSANQPATTILHGHYRDWFADHPTSEPVPGRLAFVGLVRQYKGVEDLIRAVASSTRRPLTLRVSGRPTSPENEAAIRSAAGSDGRITLDLRHLDDADFVAAITSAEMVVLPYRQMHNSGTALAALSLTRPVLVPDNRATRDLADEVGSGWVRFFDGAITAAAIDAALDEPVPATPPDLSRREWSTVSSAHAAAYRQAVASRARSNPRGS